MEDIVLVADFGTSNVRTSAVCLDNGAILYCKSEKYRPIAPQAGYSELDPEDVWRKVQSCFGFTVGQIDLQRFRIRAISFSFIGESLLPVDEKGDPTYNLLLCMDPRGGEEAQELNALLGLETVTRIIGDGLESGSAGAKIAYVKKNMPQVAARTAMYYNLQQYIFHKMGLPALNDLTSACRKSLLDMQTEDWSAPLLEAIGLRPEQLGDIVLPTAVMGSVDHFGDVPLPYPVAVVPGAHDAHCGYLGLGVDDGPESGIAEVSGTFEHIGMILGQKVNCQLLHPGKDIWSSCGPIPGSTACLSAFATYGSILEWFMASMVGRNDQAAYQDLWDHVTFDAAPGVEVAPGFIQGKGGLLNLTVTTSAYDVFKGIIETLTFETRRCIETSQLINPDPITTVKIGGGASKQDQWVQLRADITGLTFQRMQETECSTLGAAILAAVGIGAYPGFPEAIAAMVHVRDTFTPDPKVTELYEGKYQAYLKKYYS